MRRQLQRSSRENHFEAAQGVTEASIGNTV